MNWDALGITKDDIIDRAVEKLLYGSAEGCVDLAEQIKHKALEEIIRNAREKIDAILNDALSGLMDAEFTPVDEWGEPTRGKPTNLRALVKEKATGYLAQRVNAEGKPGYNASMTRAEWLACKAARDALDYKTKQTLTDAVGKAKSELQKQVADYITQAILKR